MKSLGILIIFTTLIALSSADLFISPNPENIILKVGETKSFNFTLNNTYNLKLTDFTFTNLTGFHFPQIEILPNESKIIQFNVSRELSGIYNLISKVSFKYLVDIPLGQANHNISITDMGYNPDYLVIRRGDKVKWTNNDDIKHTLTSATFDYEILPNQSREIQFNEIGNVNYQDLILFYAGSLVVINESTSEKVNNPLYDRNWNVNVEVTLNPTSISVTNNQNNYTVESSGSKEGILTLVNNGNEIAERIVLSSNPSWIVFDENNFNLNRGDSNFVTYHINPLITKTSDTNMTHNLTLSIKGSNINDTTLNISIFIPYNSNFEDMSTSEGFLAFYTRYCIANPNLLICNNTIQQVSYNQSTIRDVEIPINLTASSVYAMLKRIQRIEDSNDRTNNEVKKVADQLGLTIPELTALLNQSVTMQKENQDNSKSRINSGWTLVIFLIICGCIIAIALTIRRRKYRTSVVAGGYNR
jgi:hypothetical protein